MSENLVRIDFPEFGEGQHLLVYKFKRLPAGISQGIKPTTNSSNLTPEDYDTITRNTVCTLVAGGDCEDVFGNKLTFPLSKETFHSLVPIEVVHKVMSFFTEEQIARGAELKKS